MLKKITIIALALAFSLPAYGQSGQPKTRNQVDLPNLGKIRKNRHIGVGVGTGTLASGFSGKYILSDALSVQANIGGCHRCIWGTNIRPNWGNYGGFAVSADMLFEMPAIQRNEIVRLGWNLGAGAGLGVGTFSDTLTIAAAFVAGITLEFQPLPIDFVLEYRPNLRFFVGDVSGVGFDWASFTGHLRFYIL